MEKTIEGWNTGKHIYDVSTDISSLFFSNDEKESALNSFYNIIYLYLITGGYYESW